MKSIKLLYNYDTYIGYINSNINIFYIKSNYKLVDFILCYQNENNKRFIIRDFILNLDYEKSDENKYIYKIKLNNSYFIYKICIIDFRSILDINIEYDDEEINNNETIIEYNSITLLIEKEKLNNIKYILIDDKKLYDDSFRILNNNNLNTYQIIFDKNIIINNKFKIVFDIETRYKFTILHIPIEYIKVL